MAIVEQLRLLNKFLESMCCKKKLICEELDLHRVF